MLTSSYSGNTNRNFMQRQSPSPSSPSSVHHVRSSIITMMVLVMVLMISHLAMMTMVHAQVWSPQPAENVGATISFSGAGTLASSSNMFDGDANTATWGWGPYNAILCPSDEQWCYVGDQVNKSIRKVDMRDGAGRGSVYPFAVGGGTTGLIQVSFIIKVGSVYYAGDPAMRMIYQLTPYGGNGIGRMATITPWMGGGTNFTDPDAILPTTQPPIITWNTISGGCNGEDDNTIYVLDGGLTAIRRVTISPPSVTRYIGSYTQAGVNDGNRLTQATVSQIRSCVYNKRTNMFYWTGEGKLRQLNMNTDRVLTLVGRYGDGNVDGELFYAATASAEGIALDDTNDRIYWAGMENNAIRVLTNISGAIPVATYSNDALAGLTVSTLAGGYLTKPYGTAGYVDGPTGNETLFDYPTAITKYGDHLLVVDRNNYRLRRVALPVEIVAVESQSLTTGAFSPWRIWLSRACTTSLTLQVSSAHAAVYMTNYMASANVTIAPGTTQAVVTAILPWGAPSIVGVNATMITRAYGVCGDSGEVLQLQQPVIEYNASATARIIQISTPVPAIADLYSGETSTTRQVVIDSLPFTGVNIQPISTGSVFSPALWSWGLDGVKGNVPKSTSRNFTYIAPIVTSDRGDTISFSITGTDTALVTAYGNLPFTIVPLRTVVFSGFIGATLYPGTSHRGAFQMTAGTLRDQVYLTFSTTAPGGVSFSTTAFILYQATPCCPLLGMNLDITLPVSYPLPYVWVNTSTTGTEAWAYSIDTTTIPAGFMLPVAPRPTFSIICPTTMAANLTYLCTATVSRLPLLGGTIGMGTVISDSDIQWVEATPLLWTSSDTLLKSFHVHVAATATTRVLSSGFTFNIYGTNASIYNLPQVTLPTSLVAMGSFSVWTAQPRFQSGVTNHQITITLTRAPLIGWLTITPYVNGAIASQITFTPTEINVTTTTPPVIMVAVAPGTSMTSNVVIQFKVTGDETYSFAPVSPLSVNIYAQRGWTTPTTYGLVVAGTTVPAPSPVIPDRTPDVQSVVIIPQPPFAGITFMPPSFIFSYGFPNTEVNFTMIVASNLRNSTNNRIRYAIGGFDSPGYYAPADTLFSVRATDPMPPQCISVMMGPAGTRVIVTFDIPTNVPGTITGLIGWPRTATCSAMGLTQASLGVNPVCEWTNDVTLTVYYGIGASQTVGDVFTIANRTIGNRDAPALTIASFVMPISAPATPTQPTIVLATPSTVGSCNDITLDASQSTTLTRGYGNYTWTVTLASSSSITPTVLSSLAAIRAVIMSPTKFASSVIVIPSSIIAVNQSYVFTVSVMNFLGVRSAPSSVTVFKSPLALPSLIVAGPATPLRSQAIDLKAILTFPSCAVITTTWTYKWSMAAIPVAVGTPTVVTLPADLDTDERTLSFAPRTLTAGYVWSYQVASGPIGWLTPTVTAKWTFTVLATPMVAIITGGNRKVDTTQPTLLDGSQSYDPDKPVVLGGPRPIAYRWTCALILLPEDTAAVDDLCKLAGFPFNNSIITVPANTLLPSREYTITMTVTSYDGVGRTATDVMILTTAPLETATGVMISVSVAGISLSRGDTIPTNQPLRLQGTVDIMQGTIPATVVWTRTWTEVSNSLAVSIDTIKTSQNNTLSLVLPAGVLSNTKTYTFRLIVIASLVDGTVIAAGYGDIIRRTSLPPSSLSMTPISVTPSIHGIAAQTRYTFTATGWSADLEPLSYSFKIINDGITAVSTLLGDATISTSSIIQSYLPAGNLTIALDVSNAIGETTRVITTVSVLSASGLTSGSPSSPDVPVDDIAKNISTTLLVDATRTNDSPAIITLIKIISDLLNSAPVNTSETETIDSRTELRNNLTNLLHDTINDISIEQITQVLQTLTGSNTELSNATIARTIDIVTQLIDILLRQSDGTLGTGTNDDTVNTIVTTLVGVISNLLDVPVQSSCRPIAAVQDHAGRLITAMLTNTIAGEDPSLVTTPNIIVGGQRSFTGVTPTVIALGGSNVAISLDAVAVGDIGQVDDNDDVTSDGDTNNYADIRIIRYLSSQVQSCLGVNTTATDNTIITPDTPITPVDNTGGTGTDLPIDTPISPITNITITSSNGTVLLINNLPTPIIFDVPVSQSISYLTDLASRTCKRQVVTCSYWDTNTNEWSSQGCTTLSTMAMDDGISGNTAKVTCSCNHLTEFAILARQATACDSSTAMERTVYSSFAVLYGVVALLAISQLGRIVSYTKRKCKLDLMASEHVCVIIITVFRCVMCVMRAELSWSSVNVNDAPLVAIGLLTAVPYMFEFIAYTFLVANWAAIYHFAMQQRGSNPFAKLKLPFIIANTILAILTFGIFGAISTASSASVANTMVQGATIGMSIITLVMVILYLIYGSRLIGELTKTGSKESPVVKNLYYNTAGFCACFLLETAIWIVSVLLADQVSDNDAPILAAYYAVNLLSLLVILSMFRGGVNKLAPKRTTSSGGTDHSKNDTNMSTGGGSSRNGVHKSPSYRDTSSHGGTSTRGTSHKGGNNSHAEVMDHNDTHGDVEMATSSYAKPMLSPRSTAMPSDHTSIPVDHHDESMMMQSSDDTSLSSPPPPPPPPSRY